LLKGDTADWTSMEIDRAQIKKGRAAMRHALEVRPALAAPG
jgi:hypothetical protein